MWDPLQIKKCRNASIVIYSQVNSTQILLLVVLSSHFIFERFLIVSGESGLSMVTPLGRVIFLLDPITVVAKVLVITRGTVEPTPRHKMPRCLVEK